SSPTARRCRPTVCRGATSSSTWARRWRSPASPPAAAPTRRSCPTPSSPRRASRACRSTSPPRWRGTARRPGPAPGATGARPSRIEGNPKHPESLGSTNTYIQADVLNMYDPDRSTSPSEKGTNRTWDDAAAAIAKLGAKHKADGGKGLAILTEAHRSPTTARLLARLKSELPGAQVFRYEPWSRDNARAGAELAFGKVLESVYDLARAKVVVTLDSDILHSDGGG